MVAEAVALGVVALVALAEWLHGRRCRRLAGLAFGPRRRPAGWVGATPPLCVAAFGLLAWGLVTLLLLDPKVHNRQSVDPAEIKQLLLLVDVSPSMYLEDAGVEKNQPRRQRAAEVMKSLLQRLPMRQYEVTVIAFYTDAKPLVQHSTDIEILPHLIAELPIYVGFRPGKTDLFAGLRMAAQTARSWRPGSTTLVVLTDGMTVPATGMPRLPPAISKVLLVGVGDPNIGLFIDGHQSRQDIAGLRQVANRLGGLYHNGNSSHIPTSMVHSLHLGAEREGWLNWTRRELALAAVTVGAVLLSLIPLALHLWGTSWNPAASRYVVPARTMSRTGPGDRLNTKGAA